MNNWTEKDYRLATFIRIWWWFPLAIIILLAMLKACIGNGINHMDDSVNQSRKIVEHVEVTDSARNGFRVVYATRNSVTDERYEEIISRPHIKDGFVRLKRDAPKHFGNMFYTDIHDFARFALKYDTDKDVVIHNIFVSGSKKTHLYVGPNPQILNPATWIDPNTEQGIQYLSYKDIYFTTDTTARIYRYWKCLSIFSMSYEDEQFSHFSEDERVW